MHWFSRVIIRNYHQLTNYNNRHLLCDSSGNWESKTKMSAGSAWFQGSKRSLCLPLLASEGYQQSLTILGLWQHDSNLCFCFHIHSVYCLLVSKVPSFIRIPGIGSGAQTNLAWLRINLNASDKTNKVTFIGTGVENFNISFGGTQFKP